MNALSKKDAHPMPSVDEMINTMGRSRFITTMDLTKGHWVVPVWEKDREIIVFKLPSFFTN